MILTKIVSQSIKFFVKNKIKFFALSSIHSLIIRNKNRFVTRLGHQEVKISEGAQICICKASFRHLKHAIAVIAVKTLHAFTQLRMIVFFVTKSSTSFANL